MATFKMLSLISPVVKMIQKYIFRSFILGDFRGCALKKLLEMCV